MVSGADWLLLQNMYSDLTSVVKWEGTLSCPFVIRQGVCQGGVLSTAHYKRYNNPLLIQLENKFTGAKIGHIRIPHVTVADDLTLMSHSQTEMQSMVPTSGDCVQNQICDSSQEELYSHLLGQVCTAEKYKLPHERC